VRAADETLRRLRRGGDDDFTVLTKLKVIAGMWQVVTQFSVVMQVRCGDVSPCRFAVALIRPRHRSSCRLRWRRSSPRSTC